MQRIGIAQTIPLDHPVSRRVTPPAVDKSWPDGLSFLSSMVDLPWWCSWERMIYSRSRTELIHPECSDPWAEAVMQQSYCKWCYRPKLLLSLNLHLYLVASEPFAHLNICQMTKSYVSCFGRISPSKIQERPTQPMPCRSALAAAMACCAVASEGPKQPQGLGPQKQLGRGEGLQWETTYSLVNNHITRENHHFEWDNSSDIFKNDVIANC